MRSNGFIELGLRIVTHRLARLLPEELRNLRLRINFLLHFLQIEDRLDPGFRIAGSDGCVTGHTRDTALGRAVRLAAGGQVAVTQADVELQDEGFGGLAVAQVDGLFYEPDDVAGQLGHLGFAESDAGNQVPGLGDGGARRHQRLVLSFVVGVAVEETPAGKLGDLFAEQALFVEAVAETRLGGGRVERRFGVRFGAGVLLAGSACKAGPASVFEWAGLKGRVHAEVRIGSL